MRIQKFESRVLGGFRNSWKGGQILTTTDKFPVRDRTCSNRSGFH